MESPTSQVANPRSSVLHSSIRISDSAHSFPPATDPSSPNSAYDADAGLGGDRDGGDIGLDEIGVLKEAMGFGSHLSANENGDGRGRGSVHSYQAHPPTPLSLSQSNTGPMSPTSTFHTSTTIPAPDTANSSLNQSTAVNSLSPDSQAPLSPSNLTYTTSHGLHRQSSRKSNRAPNRLSGISSNPYSEIDGQQGGEDEEDMVFGTPPRGVIGKHRPRAVVRVERDWSAGGAATGRVQFWDGWVAELEGRVTPLQLQNTLNELNAVLASAYDPRLSIFDNTLAVLTFYLSPYVVGSHYRRQMKKFEEILNRENEKVYNPVGLHFVHPRKAAFLFLEIEYY